MANCNYKLWNLHKKNCILNTKKWSVYSVNFYVKSKFFWAYKKTKNFYKWHYKSKNNSDIHTVSSLRWLILLVNTIIFNFCSFFPPSCVPHIILTQVFYGEINWERKSKEISILTISFSNVRFRELCRPESTVESTNELQNVRNEILSRIFSV